jgi:hypothetical protein
LTFEAAEIVFAIRIVVVREPFEVGNLLERGGLDHVGKFVDAPQSS